MVYKVNKKLLPLIGRSYQMQLIAAKHGCGDHIAIFLTPRDWSQEKTVDK